jgi:1-acyl-sn-glycerol-3-phosphate acyltransferase
MSVPLVIFVEGGTGPGGRLLPFRYGAFEIAILTGNSFLPCAIIHEQEGLVVRHQNESLLRSIWRLGQHTRRANVHLEVIDPVQPRSDDDARLLALETQAAMSELLPYPARAA